MQPLTTIHPPHSAQQMSSFHSEAPRSHGSQLQRPEELAQANSEYIQKIRQRLEEDAAARQQREKRRRRVLVEQLKAHEAQEVSSNPQTVYDLSYYMMMMLLMMIHVQHW